MSKSDFFLPNQVNIYLNVIVSKNSDMGYACRSFRLLLLFVYCNKLSLCLAIK
jgi:hypothetical protein